MKRLSIGLLMTILVAGAITPTIMPDVFAATNAPTFGIDSNTHRQIVDGGVTFNHNTYDIVDNFHTDFDRQRIMVGVDNIVAMKVYAPYELKWVEFIFDTEPGASNNAKASVFIPFDLSTNSIDQDNVRIDQDENLIKSDRLEVISMMTTCTDSDVEELCYLIAVKVNFNKQPDSGVFAIKAVDEKNRSTTTYLGQ